VQAVEAKDFFFKNEGQSQACQSGHPNNEVR